MTTTTLGADAPRRWQGRVWAVINDARRRQRRRRLRTGIALAAVAAAGVGWSLSTNHPDHRTTRPPVASTATATTSVAVGGETIAAAAAPGALWVLSCVRECSGPQPSVGQLVEVASSSGIVIKRFPVAEPEALTIGGGAIWIAHFPTGTVTRVDPRDGRTTATTHLVLPAPIVRHDRQFLPAGISLGAGKVWVWSARGWVAEIDQQTSRLVAMLRSPSEDNVTVVRRSGTWVAEELAGLGFAAPGAHQVSIRPVSFAGQHIDVNQLAAGGGLIWVYGSFLNPAYTGEHWTSVVTAIDPRTHRTVSQWQFAGANDSFAYDDGATYVGDFQQGLLFRISPNHTVQTLHSVRGSEGLVAATPGALWATTNTGKMVRLSIPSTKPN
jgi:hypothetical protein